MVSGFSRSVILKMTIRELVGQDVSRYSEVSSGYTQMGWLALTSSRVDYIVWKSFSWPEPPFGFSPSVDIYVDLGYAGTANWIGESPVGVQDIAMAIQAGVGQGFWISETMYQGRKKCLWHVVSHGQETYIESMLQNEASGVLDIALDALELAALSCLSSS